MDLIDHPELGPLVATQAGVLTVGQLTRHLSYGQVRAQLTARRWRRTGHGVVLLANGEPTDHQRQWAALLQSPPGSALSGPTAAALDGFRLPVPVGLLAHVTIPCGERRPQGIRAHVHWSRFLGDDEVHPTRRPRHTRLPRSVLDWAAWQVPDAERDVRVIVLSAVQQRLTTPDQLREHLVRRGPCRHHALITESIDDAEGGIASIPEHDFKRIIRRVGLPKPTRQAVRYRPSGRAYLDVDWERYGYSAEVEGAQHFEAAHRDADLARFNDLIIAGDRVLQFSSYAIRRTPKSVAEVLVRALRSGGWTGLTGA